MFCLSPWGRALRLQQRSYNRSLSVRSPLLPLSSRLALSQYPLYHITVYPPLEAPV